MKKKILKCAEETKAGACIHFKKMPDNMILITGFSGILTREELEKKYGEEIVSVYEQCLNHMFLRSSEGLRIFTENDDIPGGFGKGSVFNHKTFGEIVAGMKKCGTTLAAIVKTIDSGEIRTIRI